jgi:tRNA(fMet)-specific endonuclease VapC
MSQDTWRYLLDTNILSDLVRHPAGAVAQRIQQLGEATVCTSIIVAAELRFGAVKKASPPLSQRIEALLDAVPVLPFEAEADRAYAEIRQFLEQQGTPIGPNDLLIAAHAVSQGLVLVTDNVGEFSRVPDLQVENWLK